MLVIESKSPKETVRIGKKIGQLLKQGDVIALLGELGTGKTQLIKGIAEGIGIKNSRYVKSPSFTFINEYKGKTILYHIDLYRIKDEKEVLELGLEEILSGQKGVTAIEWAEKILSLLPNELLMIKLNYAGGLARSIEIVAKGKRYEDLLGQLDLSPKKVIRE